MFIQDDKKNMANKNPNTKNLLRSEDLTSEELRNRASKAGKASVEARRRKKSMREALEMMLYDVELDEQTKERLKAQGVTDKKDFNHQMVITRSLIAKAEAGDVQAYNAICAMIGEKPAEKVDLSGGMKNELCITHVSRSAEDTEFPSSEAEVDV